MAYRKMNPIVWWWRRRRLEAAIAWASADESSQRARKVVVERFQGCPLLVAVRELPEMAINSDGHLAEDVHVEFLTSEGDEGEVVLVFTSPAELRERAGAASFLALPIESIVNSMGPDCTGIVLNPAGRWAFLPRAELPGAAMAS